MRQNGARSIRMGWGRLMIIDSKHNMGEPDENGNYVSKNGWYIPKEVIDKAVLKYFDENPDKACLLSKNVKKLYEELSHSCTYSMGVKHDN
jgi:hypothetical protein